MRLLDALASRGEDLGLLVVRMGALGDILRTVPAVRLLRRVLPDARIHWVVDAPWRIVLDGHPDLDGLTLVSRREWRRRVRSPTAWPGLWRSMAGLRDELRALTPALALDFQANLRSGIVSRWSGAPVRLGYAGHQQKEGNHWLTTHRVDSADRRVSRIERNLDLVRALGLPDGPLPPCDLPLVAAGREAAQAILRGLRQARGYSVITPGASARQAYKKPPAALLAAASRSLHQRRLVPLVVWGPGEEADAREVVERTGGAAILAPPTDLAALAALLAGARLLVGGDSGPLHLACAVGAPVLGLYGPTDPEVNRPWAVPHRAIHPPGRRYTGIKRLDRRAGGFDGLGEGQVEEALDDLLDEIPASRP